MDYTDNKLWIYPPGKQPREMEVFVAIIRLYTDRVDLRAIAKLTRTSRNTVKKYVGKRNTHNVKPKQGVLMNRSRGRLLESALALLRLIAIFVVLVGTIPTVFIGESKVGALA